MLTRSLDFQGLRSGFEVGAEGGEGIEQVSVVFLKFVELRARLCRGGGGKIREWMS